MLLDMRERAWLLRALNGAAIRRAEGLPEFYQFENMTLAPTVDYSDSVEINGPYPQHLWVKTGAGNFAKVELTMLQADQTSTHLHFRYAYRPTGSRDVETVFQGPFTGRFAGPLK